MLCQVTHLEQASHRSDVVSSVLDQEDHDITVSHVDTISVHFIKVVSAGFLHFVVSLFTICN